VSPPIREVTIHVEIAVPKASVLVFRPFRNDVYIKRHVSYVVKESAEQGERHIARNLASIRSKLEAMGLDHESVEDEMRPSKPPSGPNSGDKSYFRSRISDEL
jgi:hypothetical protein